MALALVFSVSAFAEGFGLVGGFTTSQLVVKEIDMKACTGFNAGVMYNIPLVSGLAIQPELLYNVKGASLDAIDLKSQLGYVELPVQLQWGLDLIMLRPYVFAEPFVGYAVSGSSILDREKMTLDLNELKTRLEYGFGLGAGVELMSRIQVSLKYFWNMENFNSAQGFIQGATDNIKDHKSFDGLAVSAAIIF